MLNHSFTESAMKTLYPLHFNSDNGEISFHLTRASCTSYNRVSYFLTVHISGATFLVKHNWANSHCLWQRSWELKQKKKHLKASAEGWNSDASTFFFFWVFGLFFFYETVSTYLEEVFVLKLRKWQNHLKVTATVITFWCVRVCDTCHLIPLLLTSISSHHYLLLFFFPLSCALPLFHFLFLQPVNPHDFLTFLHQRSAWLRWRSAAPNCLATLRAWYSVATNAPSHAPVTRPCSCTCRSTLSSSLTSASSAITTAVGGAS